MGTAPKEDIASTMNERLQGDIHGRTNPKIRAQLKRQRMARDGKRAAKDAVARFGTA